MKFLSLFIRRPVIGIVLAITIILFGLMGASVLPLRQFPVFTPSKITITTQYLGASPDVIEGFVSTPIENALAGMQGVDYITAQNYQNQSIITVNLFQGYDADKALTEISARIESVRWQLPKDILNPEIVKQPSSSPAIYLGMVGSKSVSLEQVSDYVRHTLKPMLLNVKGASSLLLVGPRDYAMRIWLDPIKMAEHNVTPLDVSNALAAYNVAPAVGQLNGKMIEYNLSANSLLSTPKEFDDIVIQKVAGYQVRLGDVGYAAYGAKDNTQASFIDGKPDVVVGVLPKDTAGNIAVANRVMKLLPKIRAHLPEGMHAEVLWNTTQFSQAALKNVIMAIIFAVVFVMIVVVLFIGSIRAALIPFVTIPLSLLGAMGVLWLIGYSFNSMTLLAFALAIGLVVDDAIVVLENTHRLLEVIQDKYEAALEGLREIAPAVVVMTLIVAVVFVPIAFTSGITGVLFKEFALTLAITVLFSGLLALLLSPLMSAQLLGSRMHTRFMRIVDRIFASVTQAYIALLAAVMRVKSLIVVLMIVIFVLLFLMLRATPQALLPEEDQGVILGVGVAPTYANLDYSIFYANKMSKVFQTIPEMQRYGMLIGYPLPTPTQIIAFVMIRPHQKGDRSEAEIMRAIAPALSNIKGIMAFPMNRPPLADVSGFGPPLNFVMQTTGSYEGLYHVMEKMQTIAANNPGLLNIQSNLKINKPAITLNINRVQAAELGVPVSRITQTLNFLLGKPIVGWFSSSGWSYPVVPQLIKQYRLDPEQLGLVQVRSDNGELVPLSSVLTFETKAAPDVLNQFQQLRSATLTANLAPGYTMGQALAYLRNVADQVMTPEMQYTYSGESRIFVNESGQMVYLFIGALLAVYLLMVIKFSSFVDPLIVLISVPLSMIGAFAAIHLVDANLNIYTQIGLLMLVGLISKQSILIVDFANHLQLQGKTVDEAILEASKIRLRPILMTAFAMIFGAIPLVLSDGPGHVALVQIGAVVIGGLSIGSLFSLFIVPVIYSYIARELKPGS